MSKFIAIMGWPKSGKNEVASILERRYGAVTVDDGLVLRLAAPMLFAGVDLTDCFTQAGKDKLIDVCGKDYTVRKLLGDLGQLLEDTYGEFFVADQTLKRIAKLAPAAYYALPSVRKRQGHFYREKGGFVFHMDRDVPASPHAFDRFDTTASHDVIMNRGSLEDLEREVDWVMHRYLNDHRHFKSGAPKSSRPQVDVREFVKGLAEVRAASSY